MKIVSSVLIVITIAQAGAEQPRPIHPQIERVMKLAADNEKWQVQDTLSSKMWLLREEIGELSIVSDPVSDRYLITKLGGPIDLVHFLALCAQVCSQKYTLEKALYRQWEAEGGVDHEKGLSRVYYPEAHPDDLPSNAFGALLGSELIDRQDDLDADLEKILSAFFAPLLVCDDVIAKQYSHRFIVMGLPENPSRNLLLSRSEWFTATPMYMLSVLEPALKIKLPNSKAALRGAGFEVYSIEEKPIGIRRVNVVN